MFNMQVQMEILACFTCGLPYCVTKAFFDERRMNDEAVRCPSGHENFFKTVKEIEDEDVLREKLTKALADAAAARSELAEFKGRMVELRSALEQTEARLADRGGMVAVPKELPEVAEVVIQRTEDGLACPVCGQPFRTVGYLSYHARRLHHEIAPALKAGKYRITNEVTMGGAV